MCFEYKLTRINVVFSRIALVSHFCAEIQLSGKFPENIAKLLFYRRLTEPEDETEKSHEGPTPPGHAGQARPRQGVGAASSPHFAYIKSLT
jgi:hypothetical protein